MRAKTKGFNAEGIGELINHLCVSSFQEENFILWISWEGRKVLLRERFLPANTIESGRFFTFNQNHVMRKPNIIQKLEKDFPDQEFFERKSGPNDPPGKLAELEKHWAKPLSYTLDQKGHMTTLCLKGLGLTSFEITPELKHLKILDLSGNRLKRIEFPAKPQLDLLEYLDLSYNQISLAIYFLIDLPSLRYLMIYESNLWTINFPRKCFAQLETWNLGNNKLGSLDLPSGMKSLVTLNLADNKLEDINAFPKKDYLIAFLEKQDIFFRINGNRLLKTHGLEEGEKGDYKKSLLDLLLPYKKEVASIKINLPAKVLLLGNHSSGKSSLLHYLQAKKEKKKEAELLVDDPGSTHIINIEKYPQAGKNIPEAIIYDFGGQDYYHGLYQLFLSFGAVQLLLWTNETNRNEVIAQDSNQTNTSTIHYDLKYWLGQDRYRLEKEMRKRGTRIHNPMLLVQRDSGENSLNSGLPSDILKAHNVKGEYLVTLSKKVNQNDEENHILNRLSREMLFAHYASLIAKNQIKLEVRNWYSKFLKMLLDEKENHSHKPLSFKQLKRRLSADFDRKTKEEDDTETDDSLRETLKRLHNQGLILFYHNTPELEDKIWLSPEALATHVHSQALEREKVKDYPDGKVPYEDFKKLVGNDAILTLLEKQKVVFLHAPDPEGTENPTREYILANYLPIAQQEKQIYDLLTFGMENQVAFILKFDSFLPFGFINQLICFFGTLPDKKHFWRNQLIFTLENKCKVFLRLDFTKLELKVCATFSNPRDQDIYIPFLYQSILDLYWAETEPPDLDEFKKILKEKRNQATSQNSILDKGTMNSLREEKGDHWSAKIIKDLYISRDGEYFILAEDLEKEENTNQIRAFRVLHDETKPEIDGNPNVSEPNNLDLMNPVVIPAFAFQNFTENKLTKMKKIFISYSNEDIYFKQELEKHLKPLSDFNLAKAWSCEEMKPGAKWHDQIQKELLDSDIVIFMLSINFVNSQYILNEEVWKTFEQVKENPNKKMVFVVVRDFSWRLFGKFGKMTGLDEKTLNGIKTAKTLDEITQGQFLPYFTQNPGEEESKRYLLALEEWDFPNKAYMQIIEKLTENW